MEEIEFPRLDKSVLTVASSFEEAEAEDRKYWHSRTPIERLQHTEYLRRLNYGNHATARLQRILEIVERT